MLIVVVYLVELIILKVNEENFVEHFIHNDILNAIKMVQKEIAKDFNFVVVEIMKAKVQDVSHLQQLNHENYVNVGIEM